MPRADEVLDIFLEAAGNLGESLGLNRTVCQIYALLYLSPRPLSAADIGEALRISKGNVSVNLRTLLAWNAVKKVWKKGQARAMFSANDNVQEIVLERLHSGIVRRVRQMRNHLQTAEERARKARAGADASFYRRRIKQAQDLLSQVERFCASIQSLQALMTTRRAAA